MRRLIPAPVIAAAAEVVVGRETHASLDSLFIHAGAPGDPPEGSKWVKAQEWLRRLNKDESLQPLQVLGRLIEAYMEEPPSEGGPFDDFPPATETPDQQKIKKALARYDLQYVRGGSITGSLGTPSRNLDDFIRDRDLPALDQEFTRALSASPKAHERRSPQRATSSKASVRCTSPSEDWSFRVSKT